MENLTESELREACRARGIRGNVFGEGAPAFMRKKLADWLELSLNRWAHVISVLLSFTSGPPASRFRICTDEMGVWKPSAGVAPFEVCCTQGKNQQKLD